MIIVGLPPLICPIPTFCKCFRLIILLNVVWSGEILVKMLFVFFVCLFSKMRWQTVHTWALRAHTVSVKPSLMRTQGLLYPQRCMRMWRRTVASRQLCMTQKMAEIGQYKYIVPCMLYSIFIFREYRCCTSSAEKIGCDPEWLNTSPFVIHLL